MRRTSPFRFRRQHRYLKFNSKSDLWSDDEAVSTTFTAENAISIDCVIPTFFPEPFHKRGQGQPFRRVHVNMLLEADVLLIDLIGMYAFASVLPFQDVEESLLEFSAKEMVNSKRCRQTQSNGCETPPLSENEKRNRTNTYSEKESKY